MSYSRFVSTRSVAAFLTATALASVVSVAFVGKPQPVQAFPAFKDKEGVSCGYCHTSAAGGGKRNYRGKFYKKNNLTFAGFDDAAEAKAAGEEIGLDADQKPKSLTPPAGATTPVEAAPVEATPAPVPTPAPAPKPSVADLKKKAAVTAAALKKSPKSAAAKKAHSASLSAVAKAVMGDTTIPPAKRYPEALTLLRQAVTLDPTNKAAATDKKMIEDVYKQMGRPLPK